MSSSSPAKNNPGQTLLAIVLKLISPSFTPPHVTNSSLFKLLPVTENSVRVICCVRACVCARVSTDQRVSRTMPAAKTSSSHNRAAAGAVVGGTGFGGWHRARDALVGADTGADARV